MKRALNMTRSSVLCARLEEAANTMARSKGLIGRAGLDQESGMLFAATPLIPLMWMHTFFMLFPIDMVFVDRSQKIIRIMHNVKPWRFTAPVARARWVMELTAGAAARNQSQPGDLIRFESV